MDENLEIITQDIHKRYGIEFESIMLHHVLFWYGINYSSGSSFEVRSTASYAIGVFKKYEELDRKSYIWNLQKPYLYQQGKELIQFLADLVNQSSPLKG